MTWTITVLGTDAIRYVFEYDYKNYFKIKYYANNVLPFFDTHDKTAIDKEILKKLNCNNWKDSLVKTDIEGSIFEELLKHKSDYIVIDFHSITMGYFESPDSSHYYCNYTNYGAERNNFVHKDIDVINKTMENRFNFFLDKLFSIYSPSNVIFIKTLTPKYCKRSFGNAFETGMKFDSVGAIFDILYRYSNKKDISLNIIDLTKYSILYENNPWGKYNGFIPVFYEKAIDQLYHFIDAEPFCDDDSYDYLKKSQYALLKNNYDYKYPFESLGRNTGNNTFWSSIEHLFNPDIIPYDKKEILSNYKLLISTDLIWIREGVDYSYLTPIFESINYNVVLLSVGLQSNEMKEDFHIHDSVINLLKNVEKKKTVGVRGEYTYRILKKYGINNMMVIGCPSMYYWNNRNFKVIKNDNMPFVLLSNFRAFYGKITEIEKKYLKYIINNKSRFIEQNKIDYDKLQDIDSAQKNYLIENSKVYFTNHEWLKGIWNYTFAMGLRFHGNVMALRAGIPALFITTDTRTTEMTEYFGLPSLNINDFDDEKKLDYYLELADYKKFNNKYPKIFDKFITFLTKNGMKIETNDVKEWDGIKNTIEIKTNEITRRGLVIGYEYNHTIKGKWQTCFNGNGFKVIYSKPLGKKGTVPESISILPFIGNILPLSWLCNAKIIVNQIDQNFFDHMEFIKKSLIKMTPNEYFKGSLVYNKLCKNRNRDVSSKELLFYSGGVDAVNSLIDLIDHSPALFTIRGSDIFFSENDDKAWDIVVHNTKEMASSNNLDCIFCESTFRMNTDTINMKSWINRAIKSSDNYWHLYQHGIALICHSAPLAYYYNFNNIHIASSYTSKEKIVPCGSLPQIDENVRFSNCKVHHNCFGDSRSDKIQKIIQYCKNNKTKIALRVCWQTRTGYNCCLCEKCIRTILSLMINNEDPNDYGFQIDNDSVDKIINKIESKDIIPNSHWKEIIANMDKQNYKNNKLVDFIIQYCR